MPENKEIKTMLDAKTQDITPARQPSTLDRLLSDPVQLKEFPIETVERLITLQVEHRKENARLEFASAFNAVQAEMVPVVERGKNLHTKSTYATLADVLGMLTPLLAKHGFSHSLSSKSSEIEGHTIFVLTLRHIAGHIETHELDAPLDYIGMSGKTNKTKLQGLASSYTYCERHLLCKVFGVQTLDKDDDGNAGGGVGPSAELICTDQVIVLKDLIEATKADEKKFLDYFQVPTVADLPVNQFRKASSMLKQRLKEAT